MGKNLISQRRGKGTPRYRSPAHRFIGKAKHAASMKTLNGSVIDIVHSAAHSAPIAVIRTEDDAYNLMIAPDGIRVNDVVQYNNNEVKLGNTLMLKNMPEGTLIFNIEAQPGDGGKFVRSSGTSARIVTKQKTKVSVLLPSKKMKDFDEKCRASIGVVSGGGREEKPFLKAGTKYFRMRSRNKLWPIVCGTSMNAVDHPFGTSRSSKKGQPTIASKNAPPGANVGKIRPRRTGKKR